MQGVGGLCVRTCQKMTKSINRNRPMSPTKKGGRDGGGARNLMEGSGQSNDDLKKRRLFCVSIIRDHPIY